MLTRLSVLLLALPTFVGCWDTNVRDISRSAGIYSTDGEHIATIRYRYEGYNNLVTNGSGPGRREFRFSVYSQESPRVGRDRTAVVQGFPEGLGERFDYDGHLEDAHYVHTADRRYIVGRYIDGEDPRVPVMDRTRVERPALLRMGADGRPRGGWRFLSDRTQVFETVRPTDDGALIAVVTRRDLGEANSAFVVTFYDGDTLAVVHTEEVAGDLNSRHSGWFRGRWHKTPTGWAADDIAADLAEAAALSRQTVHPASPAWPARHAAQMAQIERRRTMADFEWTFGAQVNQPNDHHRVSARRYTFRADGRVERGALPAESLEEVRHEDATVVYRARPDGTSYTRYLVEEGTDQARIYAPIDIALALEMGAVWEMARLSFKYRVTFGADYPYNATFNVTDVDEVRQTLRGQVEQVEEAYGQDALLDHENLAVVRLDWTRDAEGLLHTCFIHAPDGEQLARAEVDSTDLEAGCDGAPWDNLSNLIGQDCDGTWGGYQTGSCEMDCLGAWGGEARLDGCGVCDADAANDNTTCEQDCAGVYGGGARPVGDQCIEPANMARVPAGEFIAGTGDRQRRVDLPAFYMDVYEVTAGEYRRCVEAGGCTYQGPRGERESNWGEWSESRRTYQNGRDDHPINFISWRDAADYCAWVDKRLPTPLEWEKAARGTDGRTFPWGEDAPTCDHAVMWINGPDDGAGCGTGHLLPVGRTHAGRSPYGIYDLAGGVAEWTVSPFKAGRLEQRTMGGSYESDVRDAFERASSYGLNPYQIEGRYGVRCAL